MEDRYQFRVDGRPAGPLRVEWRDAANDAVNAGYATWGRDRVSVYWSDVASVYWSDVAGAEITRVKVKPKTTDQPSTT